MIFILIVILIGIKRKDICPNALKKSAILRGIAIYSFLSSSDVVNQEITRIYCLADELIIEMKQQYCKVKIMRLLNAQG